MGLTLNAANSLVFKSAIGHSLGGLTSSDFRTDSKWVTKRWAVPSCEHKEMTATSDRAASSVTRSSSFFWNRGLLKWTRANSHGQEQEQRKPMTFPYPLIFWPAFEMERRQERKKQLRHTETCLRIVNVEIMHFMIDDVNNSRQKYTKTSSKVQKDLVLEAIQKLEVTRRVGCKYNEQKRLYPI